jgi:hypothetical protein
MTSRWRGLVALALVAACGRTKPAAQGPDASTTGAAGTQGAAGAAGTTGAAGTAGAQGADAAAGADAPVDTGTFTGRLVPWQLAPAGTPPLVLGIVDREQKVRCRPLLATDGKLRCLPDAPVSVTSSVMPAVVPSDSFTNAACTQVIFRANADQGRALLGRPLALPAARQGCEVQRYEVRTLRALAAGAQRFRFNTTQTTCVRGPDAAASPVQLELVPDAVLSPETWAEVADADNALLVMGQRVRVQDVVTPEGALFVDHLVDLRWSTPCALDTAGKCWPPTLKGAFAYFGDAACVATRLALVPACETPVVVQQGTGLFGVGDVWTGAIFENGEGCRASTLTAPTADVAGHFRVLGAALDADAVSVPPADLAGTGRFQLHGLRGDGGGFVALPSRVLAPGQYPFFDTVAGADCIPVWTKETPPKVRCLPPTVLLGYPPSVSDFWADATCTIPAYFSSVDRELVSLEVDANGDVVASALHATTIPIEPTSLFTHLGGTCGAFTPYPGFVMAGDPIPWDKYPVLPEVNALAGP